MQATYSYADVLAAASVYDVSELYKMGYCDFDIVRAVREVEAQEEEEDFDMEYDDLD